MNINRVIVTDTATDIVHAYDDSLSSLQLATKGKETLPYPIFSLSL